MKALDRKLTNPKDAIGSTKLPMHLVPSTVGIYASMAFLEGALKYGKYNWRVAGVRFSIYLDAIHRHLSKLQDGEWADPDTKVPHLGSIIACAGIVADAMHINKLVDDRPPAALTAPVIDTCVPLVQHLKALFEAHNPHQHTIGDRKCPVDTTQSTSSSTKKRPSKSKSGKRATKRVTSSKRKGSSTKATART